MPIGNRVDVYRQEIAKEFLRGGQGYRWLDTVRRNMHRACERDAPKRTGDLRRSHRSSIRGYNQYRAEAEVVNVSDYAEAVHDGTLGSTWKNRTQPVMIARPGGGHGWSRFTEFKGQEGNPWLDDACARAATREGAVRIS